MRLMKPVILVSLVAFGLWGGPGVSRVDAQHDSGTAQPEAKQGTAPATTQPAKASALNLTYYFDNRGFNTFAVLASTTALPWGFSRWGFTDIHSDHNVPAHRFELTRYFMEYRVRRPLNPDWMLGLHGAGVELEYNDLNGPGNNVVRLGVTFKHALFGKKSWLQWRAFPYESDGSGAQVSLIHVLVLSERLSLAGFADLNMNKGAPDRWVAESELRFALNGTFDLVIEGRYNGFEEANPDLEGLGIALGLKVKP